MSQTDSPAVPSMAEDLVRIAEILRRAESVLFITGAGMSADSGLPTYRGIGGLYNDADTEEGVPIEVALSGPMFAARPAITWRDIARIEAACRDARHNRGHEIIAAMEKRWPRVCVLTQNVDGFHRDAGSHEVIEMHGNLRHLVCTGCAHRETVSDYSALDIPPHCARCGGLIRPEVVLFGELLPPAQVSALHQHLARGFDVVFSIGTTSVFPYIADPVLRARKNGKTTIEINPGQSEVSHVVDYRLRTGALHALEALWQHLDEAT